MKKLLIIMLGAMSMLSATQELKKPIFKPEQAVKVRYKNYRGEVAVRSIIPVKVYWGKTEYHPHEQWLLEVWDIEKNDTRIYAFKDIQEIMGE